MSNLTIVIPVYNHLDYTKECIENIKSVAPAWTEIIVIDDYSYDWTRERLEKQKWIKIIFNKKNMWVTYSWNLGFEKAKWDYICIINNDIVCPEWLFEKLIEWFKENRNIICTVPRRTQNPKWQKKSKILHYINHRNWFCFMVKKDCKFFPIPSKLKIFGWDNRLYWMSHSQWYKINTIKDAVIHHYRSVTSWDFKENHPDRDTFFKIANHEWWNIIPVPLVSEEPQWNVLI